MTYRDLESNIDAVASLVPAVRAATGTGDNVDLKGYDSALVIFECGTMVAGGTQTPQLQESADGTTFGTVAQANLQGTFIAFGTNAPALQRVGYIGTGRFVKVVSTFGGTGAGGPSSALVVRGHPARKPL